MSFIVRSFGKQMIKFACLWIVSLTGLSFALDGIFVKNIEECPPLTPRTIATNVHDLRPDDIKVIGALGDSYTAAAFAKSRVGDINFWQEYRGHSLYLGGDTGVQSVANFIKYYQPKLIGSSKGHHAIQLCTYKSCSTPYTPELDQLNAAQSGATASSLGTQLDYLVKTMKEMDLNFENDWKMINIEIGGNDICHSCEAFKNNTLGEPEHYRKFLDQAIDRIYKSIPKVIVNLGTSYNVGRLIKSISSRTGYCNNPKSPISDILECPCGASTEGINHMLKIFDTYDEKILNVYHKYQGIQDDQFAVVLHRANFDTRSSPDHFWTDLDCFHPSYLGQAFLSKNTWNQLFIPFSDKPKSFTFDANQMLYCPTDSDRIVTV